MVQKSGVGSGCNGTDSRRLGVPNDEIPRYIDMAINDFLDDGLQWKRYDTRSGSEPE